MTRPPRGLSPRAWAFLLIGFVCLLSFSAGLVAALGLNAWPLLAALTLALVAALWLATAQLRRLEADREYVSVLAREAGDLYHLAPCGYVALDPAGRLLTINDTALALLGAPRERLVGTALRDLVAADARPCFDAAFARLRDEPIRDLEVELVAPDGRALSVLMNVAMNGRDVPHARCTFLDLSARRRAERTLAEATAELQASREEAQRANRAKSEFLANMSHEIRTPLAGIVGLAEALAGTSLDVSQRRHVETLTRAAEGLIKLVNGILDLSKVEAGKLELEAVAFSPEGVADEALAVVAPVAGQKRLPVRREPGPGVPAAVRGDPARLRQVLLNLLSNAVKFTDRGEVVLRVDGEADGRVRFTVRDTGVGIPADKLSRIFEPFAQADRSIARTHGGTGLGLAISSRLVERMGGKLDVTSAPGKGSTFTFTLPLPAADPAPAPASRTNLHTLPRPIHVLIAEDNPVNQMVITMMLDRLGCTHELAADGEAAVLKAREGRFDLILMDLQMPEMDGLRATRMIRQAERDGPRRVPIVAVTANAMEGERQRCLAAGMDDYLTKPVRSRELVEVMNRLVGEAPTSEDGERRAEGGRRTAAPTPPPALKDLGFDREAARELARVLQETMPTRLATLRAALEGGDLALVKLTAHTFKGSFAVFGAEAAVAAAGELEAMATSGDLAVAAGPHARLEAEARRLLEALGLG